MVKLRLDLKIATDTEIRDAQLSAGQPVAYSRKQIIAARSQGRLRFKGETCSLHDELTWEDGYKAPSCPFYPGPQDCLRCPDEKLRMEAMIQDFHRCRPCGETKLIKKRHCTFVLFLDEQRRQCRNPEKFRIRFSRDKLLKTEVMKVVP